MSARKPVRPVVCIRRSRSGGPRGIGLLMVTAALLLAPAAARAQAAGSARPPDSRWWVGGGAGYLGTLTDCTNCEDDRSHGNAAGVLFQGGLRVNERVLVGGEIFATGRTIDDVSVRHTHLLGLAQFRPLAAHGFFIKLGYGMALVKDNYPLGGAETTARTWGMGLMYGAGWIFRRDRRVSIAPVAAQYVTTVGDVDTPAGTAQNAVANGWFVGAVVMVR